MSSTCSACARSPGAARPKGEDYEIEEIPADLADAGRRVAREADRDAGRDRRRGHGEVPGGRGALRRRAQGRHPARHHRRQGQPGASAARRSRTRACSPCSTRWSTTCRRRWTSRRIEGTLTDGETPVVRKPTTTEPFSGLAFKIQTDKHLGKLTYVRVYSGTLDSGTQVVNSTKDRKERIGKIYQMHANKREERLGVSAGDIIAVQGLKQTTTGDTLSDPAHPVILESMTFPEPVISVAIEPKTKADQEKLGTAIQKLAEEDPTFRVKQRRGDRPDGHLRHGRAAPGHPGRAHAPRVQRRGQRRQAAGGVPRDHPPHGGEGRATRTRSRPVAPASTPRSSSASSRCRWTPTAPTYEFVNAVTGGRIPQEFIPSVDAGAQDALQYGILAGYPVVGVKLTLVDGAVPRGRLVRNGVQDRRLDGDEGSRPDGRPGTARADDGRRGRHPRGQHG